MKKVLFNFAALIAAGLIFVSCGEKAKTPDEQFKSVIRTSVMDSTNKLAKGMDETFSQIDFSNLGGDAAITISVDDTTAGIIKGLLQNEIGDVKIDWLKSLNLSAKSTMKEQQTQLAVGVGLNGVNIFTIDCIEDIQDSKIYLRLPEVLKDYFQIDTRGAGFSLKDAAGLYFSKLKMLKSAPSKQVWTAFVDELLTAALSGVSGVERTTETLKAGIDSSKEVSADYTALSFVITPEYAELASENVQKTISESKNLRTILDWAIPILNSYLRADLSVSEVIDAFADAADDFFDDLSEIEDTSVIVYADSKSKMKGVKVVNPEGYVQSIFTQKGNNFGYDFRAVDSDFDEEIVSVCGFGSCSGNKLTGDFKVSEEMDELFSFSLDKISLDELNQLKANGAVTFRPGKDLQKDIQRELRYSGLDRNIIGLFENCAITLKMQQKSRTSGSFELALGDGSDKSYISLKVDSTTRKGDNISIPKEAVDVLTLDGDTAEKYIRSIKTDEIVANLKKAKVDDEYVDKISQLNGEEIMSLIQSF